MKKLLVGLFIFVSLTLGVKVQASWISDSMMREIIQLRSKLGAYAAGYSESGSNSSTINTPSITILSPNNGGESVEAGGKIEIRWTSPNISSALNEVYISDGFNKGHTESVRMENNEGSVIYLLDSNLIPGSNYKAYVSIDSRSAIYASDSSDNPFMIKVPVSLSSITVLTPNGRDMYEVGQQINVTWNSNGIPQGNKNINIILHGYNSNGVIVWSKELASFTYNDGQEKVVLPTNLGGVPYGKNFVISVGTDSTNNPSTVFDYSDSTFTIGQATDVINGGCSNGEIYSSTSGQKCPGNSTPSITVLSPNGGETFIRGEKNKISWNGGNNKVQVGIAYPDFKIKNLGTDMGIQAWIELNGKPNSSIVWDGISLKDLNGEKSYFNPGEGSYKIILISEDKNGNYCTPSINDGECNYDLSDNSFAIKFPSIENGCSNGEVYSSTSGQKCLGTESSSVTVLFPKGGEVFTQGAANKISWSGGKNKIQIGLFSKYNQAGSYAANNSGVVGWIFTNLVNGVNGTSGNWDGNSLTDLNGSGIGGVTPGTYKIVAISESDSGNYCLGDKNSCNSYLSGDITIKSSSNNGCSNGEVYSSTTGQVCPSKDYYMTLIQPEAGKTLIAGETYNVKWASNIPSYAYLTIKIKDNNSNLTREITTKNDGQETVRIPAGTFPGTYKVEISNGSAEHTIIYANAIFSVTSNLNTGCSNGEVYSSTTGQLCLGYDRGCNGTNFSSTTGQRCPASTITNDEGCNGTRYSITTGQYCANYNDYDSENNGNRNNFENNPTPIRRTLKWGQIGDDVKTLQQFLGIPADGVFGRGTALKVRNWQTKNGLNPDGAFGFMSRQKANLAQ